MADIDYARDKLSSALQYGLGSEEPARLKLVNTWLAGATLIRADDVPRETSRSD